MTEPGLQDTRKIEMSIPTIEDLKELQRSLDTLDKHIVYLGETRFVIAHTDFERNSGMDLEDCDLHQDLLESDSPEEDMIGYWVVDEAFNSSWTRLDT